MGIKSMVRNIYLNKQALQEQDYQRSRLFFIFEGATARTIFALTSGAFFVGFAEYLGADAQFNGILCSIPVFASIIQIFSPLILEKLARRKLIISLFCLMHRMMLGLMVFIPIFIKDTTLRLVALAAMYFISYTLVQFINPAAANWIVQLTPASMRGRYFGIRETIMLTAVTLITLVAGRILDDFRNDGQLYLGFVIVFCIVLLLAVANFVFLSLIKEPAVTLRKTPYTIKNSIALPIKDQRFRKIVILLFIWNAGLQVGGPYFAVYMKTGLNLDYAYIMVMGLIGSVANAVTSKPWGKLADSTSWAFTTKAAVGLLGIVHILWFFISPNNAYLLVPILHVFGGIAWAGINISLFNIQFQYAPEEGRTIYLGFGAAIGGLVGFGSTLLGAAIIGAGKGLKLSLGGFQSGIMQSVLALSGVGLLVCAGYIHFFIQKQDALE